MNRTIVVYFILIFSVLLIGNQLNPFSSQMFLFHDETQPARVQQFSENLSSLQIPPRIAPDFSFRMGYPVLSYYAPFSYWVAGLLNVVGISTIASVKLSFFLALIILFFGLFGLLRQWFKNIEALTGSIIGGTTLYVALDIFVRGNLAETWFMALLPLSFFFMVSLSKKVTALRFFFLIITLSALWTSHNALSIFSFPIILFFTLLLNNKKHLFLSLLLSSGLVAYFYIPFIKEISLTYAQEASRITNYSVHFLCPQQLWDGVWGFGGSVAGCIDGMSFKLGKLQLLLAGLGLLIFISQIFIGKRNPQNAPFACFFGTLFFGAIFLTFSWSKPIWDLIPMSASVQFPWRFLAFTILGISYFSAYFLSTIPKKIPQIFCACVIIVIVLLMNKKYFQASTILNKEFEKTYLSKEYMYSSVAYKIPEYLPKSVSYSSWIKLNSSKNYAHLITPIDTTLPYTTVSNTGFFRSVLMNKTGLIFINIHTFPSWDIKLNNKQVSIPYYDELGRPRMSVNKGDYITISFQQTAPQKVGNLITTISGIILIYISYLIWKRNKN